MNGWFFQLELKLEREETDTPKTQARHAFPRLGKSEGDRDLYTVFIGMTPVLPTSGLPSQRQTPRLLHFAEFK